MKPLYNRAIMNNKGQFGVVAILLFIVLFALLYLIALSFPSAISPELRTGFIAVAVIVLVAGVFSVIGG